jgi:hypothetical protein
MGPIKTVFVPGRSFQPKFMQHLGLLGPFVYYKENKMVVNMVRGGLKLKIVVTNATTL